MPTNHKPATPLPWKIVGDTTEAKIVHSSPNPAKGKGIEFPAAIISHVARMHSQWICDEHVGNPFDNARYISHAANAYPKLVEALNNIKSAGHAFNGSQDPEQLKRALDRANEKLDQCADWARALLRELGEDA